MKHSYSNDDTCFSIDVIDEILEEDFDALLNEGTENVAADHLSRIENDETSDDSEVDDNFPRETLMEINTEDEPWFADFANYLTANTPSRRNPTFSKMPKALISDSGTHFCNKIIEKTMKRYGVNHRFSTSYHPQTSCQVENTNISLKRILEKTIKDNLAIWSRKLDDALWAFRTAYETPTETTPYKLKYGKNYHLPFEIEHRAYWALKNYNLDLITAGEKRIFVSSRFGYKPLSVDSSNQSYSTSTPLTLVGYLVFFRICIVVFFLADYQGSVMSLQVPELSTLAVKLGGLYMAEDDREGASCSMVLDVGVPAELTGTGTARAGETGLLTGGGSRSFSSKEKVFLGVLVKGVKYPPPPLLDSDPSKKRRHTFDASGSLQPPAPQSSAWKMTDTRKAPSSSSKQQSGPHAEQPVEDIPMPDTANISELEDTDSAHLPKIKPRSEWLKPILEEDGPETPEPDWSSPTNDLPEPENNWANALTKSYKDLEENKLLWKTGDMGRRNSASLI
ncbi:reverse transcriptase domain-containing protein [Tanacetum coccineum]|uniref:Reverse transcriptase domain-containing protein n=1 Tax=Tanacetum coccineum TaxID=301880 RepID=A0ABQ4ZCU6_9ASTR